MNLYTVFNGSKLSINIIDLKDKNAMITGSSCGVGQQLAFGLAQLGCNIILHGRYEST